MFIIQIQQHRSDLFLFILFDSFFDRPYDIYVMASYVHFLNGLDGASLEFKVITLKYKQGFGTR